MIYLILLPVAYLDITHPPVKCFGSCEQSHFYMLLQVLTTADAGLAVIVSVKMGTKTCFGSSMASVLFTLMKRFWGQ